MAQNTIYDMASGAILNAELLYKKLSKIDTGRDRFLL